MTRHHQHTVGSALVLTHAVVWGLFPVMPVLLGRTLGPGATLAFSATFATTLLLPLAAVRRTLGRVWSWEVQRLVFVGSFLIGGLYYGLTLYGLQYTTPGNAALILLTEIVFNALFARLHHGERIGRYKAIGIVLVVCGGIMVLSRNVGAWNPGDALMVLACIFPPYGNWCMQQAGAKADSIAILAIRSAWTVLFGLILMVLLQESLAWTAVHASLAFLVVNGAVVLALAKIFWLEGIKRMPVTYAITLSKTSVFWVMIFAWVLLDQPPTAYQVLSAVPMLTGAWMVARAP